MSPVSATYEPVHPKSVDIYEFIKTQHPKLYERMLAGEEIGFKKAARLYNENKRKNDH